MASKRKAAGLFLSLLVVAGYGVQGSVDVTLTNVPSALIDIHYLSGAHVVARTGDLGLWVSHDAGVTWAEQVALRGNAREVVVSRAGKTVYVLSDDTTFWKSTDGAATFAALAAPGKRSFTWHTLNLHATQPDYIIFNAEKCPPAADDDDSGYSYWYCLDNSAHLSTDGGRTWVTLFETVNHCEFGTNGKFQGGSTDTVFCGRILGDFDDEDQSVYLTRSDNLFDPSFPVANVFHSFMTDYALVEDYVVVITPKDNANYAEMELWASKDGVTFVKSVFPSGDNWGQHDYQFVESNEGTVLMVLGTSYGSGNWAHLVSSSSNGHYFVAKLEHVHRSWGVTDFENIDSLEGVMIANQVVNWQTATFDNVQIQTVISFNDGGIWQRIPLPEGIICIEYPCSLHLHGNSERLQVGSIFSATSAVGLGAGVGNVGKYLDSYKLGDTYLTNDGGLTWKMIRKGPHLHEFGDHGAVIVLVNDLDPTDHIRYSYDEGTTWTEVTVTPSGYKLRASELTTQPDSEGLVFLLHGYLTFSNGSSTSSYVVIAIDFSTDLTVKCTAADFQTWQLIVPSDTQDRCVLGHEVLYQRRIPSSKCFIGAGSSLVTPVQEHCPCSLKDFECDFNFIPTYGSGSLNCTRIKGTSGLPADCTVGVSYPVSSGYLKIPASTCDRGLSLDKPVTAVCAQPSSTTPPNGNEDDAESTETSFPFKLIVSFQFFADSSTALMLDNSGSVWLTRDEGKTWSYAYRSNGTSGSIVSEVKMHPYKSSCAILIVPKGRSQITSDYGSTFRPLFGPNEQVSTSYFVTPTAFKRTDPNTFILVKYVCSPLCHSDAYITTDLGVTFTKLTAYVRKCVFGQSAQADIMPKAIFCEIDDVQTSTQSAYDVYSVYRSTDNFVTPKELISDSVGLLVFQQYIISATFSSEDYFGDLQLLISSDGTIFMPVDLPVTNSEGFWFLESSSVGSIFLDVLVHRSDSFGVSWGSLFISNSDCTAFNEVFSYSNRQDSSMDFERVEGVEGVLIANQITNVDDTQEGLPKIVESFISFDDGRLWDPIAAPYVDSLGKPYPGCAAPSDGCSLHVHTMAEGRMHGNVFSSSSAPGLMVAVGNVGTSLRAYETCSTFLSTDGGVTWKEVQKKPHLFEFGDRGSIIVLVPDGELTDMLHYSYDFGATWNAYTFTSRKLYASALITDPDSISLKFTIFGSTSSPADVAGGIYSRMVHVDFTGLHERKCVDSDFEEWQMVGPSQLCVLGHEYTYLRRKPSSACYIDDPLRAPKIVSTVNCSCNRLDYECDLGFLVAGPNCVPKDPSIVAEPPNCQPNSNYVVPSGYRGIAGDTCTDPSGTAPLDKPVTHKCADPAVASPTPTAPAAADIALRRFQFGASKMNQWYHVPMSPYALFVLDSGNAFVSDDEGLTWSHVELANFDTSIQRIIATADGSTVILATSTSKYYVSFTRGDSFAQATAASVVPDYVNAAVFLVPHDRDKDAILAVGKLATCTDTGAYACPTQLFVKAPTTNKVWKQVTDLSDVVDCKWLGPIGVVQGSNDDYSFACLVRNNEAPLYKVVVVYKPGDVEEAVLPAGVIDWFAGPGFLAATVFQAGSANLQADLYVWGSDTSSFEKATLPTYAVVAAKYNRLVKSFSKNLIVLDVNTLTGLAAENLHLGALYTSGSVGSDFVFTKVLNYVYRTRDTQDVQQLPGIDGIFIVNIVANPNEYASGSTDAVVHTAVSFDNGVRWQLVPAPATDDQSKPVRCEISAGCSLHLHSYTTTTPTGMRAQQMGAMGAIGMAIAVGNTGSQLGDYNAGDTFLTTNAGRTWTNIRRGPHLHAFADSGALMVIVNDKDATNHVRYSYDFGLSWQTLYFLSGDQTMRVSMLESFADATAQRVMLFGRLTTDPAFLTGVSIDFGNLHSADCNDRTDFEAFVPSDFTGRSCVLGHEVEYKRRIATHLCSVNDRYLLPTPTVENCACSAADYECDVGFASDGLIGTPYSCVAVLPGIRDEPAHCPKGTMYYVPSGFRKIPIDTCDGSLSNSVDLTTPIKRDCGATYDDPTMAPPSTPTLKPTTTVKPGTSTPPPTNTTGSSGTGSHQGENAGGLSVVIWLPILLIALAVGGAALWFYRKSIHSLLGNYGYVRVQQEEPDDLSLDDMQL